MYGQFVVKASKVLVPFLNTVMRIGQIQLIRREIANQLSKSSRFDSKLLTNALQTLNK